MTVFLEDRPLHAPETIGTSSSSEHAGAACQADITRVQARDHYDLMLKLTREAARELHAAISTRDVRRVHVLKLANQFAWANRSLWMAAREIVRLERLPDDGAELGLIFEILL